MDKTERAQIRLLLEHHSAGLREKSASLQKALAHEHASKGILRSGKTVKDALRIAEEIGTEFVKSIVAAVSDVAQDIEAFNLMRAETIVALRDLQAGVDGVVELALGKGAKGESHRSTKVEANRMFQLLQERLLQLLELHRFSFTRPSPADREAMRIKFSPQSLPPPPGLPKNKGGKPVAAHWDAMWSEIAVQLWLGDLQPKSQADIKRAMLNWFNDQEIEIGDTAVTERARQLWQKIDAAQ